MTEWTTPRTWVTGELHTAAMLNAHIRDNVNYLFDVPSFRLHHASAQGIPNNAITAVNFDDPVGGADPTTYIQGCTYIGPGQVQIDRAGVWSFDVTLGVADSHNGKLLIIYLRDVTNGHNVGCGNATQYQSSYQCMGQLQVDVLLDAGTVMEVHAQPINMSGTTNLVSAHSFIPLWTGYWVRDP